MWMPGVAVDGRGARGPPATPTAQPLSLHLTNLSSFSIRLGVERGQLCPNTSRCEGARCIFSSM
jgi:hypothetical protein